MSQKTFDAALKLILKYEGIYDNDPDDPGGETYKGITRRDHPDWEGWAIVDGGKEQDGFPGNLESDDHLQTSVGNLYKELYWRRNHCDELPAGLDLVVFDTAVNMGGGKAGRFLQQGVNELLGRQVLTVDGAIGNRTLSAVNALNPEQQKQLCFACLELRDQNYHEIVAARPSSKKFLKGWLNRTANLRQRVPDLAVA
jgi:lysozyme family protein